MKLRFLETADFLPCEKKRNDRSKLLRVKVRAVTGVKYTEHIAN